MQITHNGRCFIAVCSYEERELPKRAGFYWHPEPGQCFSAKRKKPCPACDTGLKKSWWTDDPVKVQPLREHCDLQALEALGEHRANVEASRADHSDVDVPVPDGLAYLPFQRAGIAYAMARESTLIGDDPGLGKTIQALGVANADPSVKSILVICPASLRLNWLREAELWLVRQRESYVVASNDPVPETAELVIANYDRLKGHVLAGLMARSWDLLVVDECHALKSSTTQRSKRVLGYWDKQKKQQVPGLISRARRKLMLTGTPILNRPKEVQPIVGALLPDQFGNFFKFGLRYCNGHQTRWGWDFDGASRLDELQERLRSTCMVRRLKAEVLKELPAKRRQVIVIPADEVGDLVAGEAAAFAAHEERLADARDAVALAHAAGDEQAYEAAVAALSSASRTAFTEISIVRHEVALAKVPVVLEHLDGLAESGVDKLIVFGHHRDVVAQIAGHYGDASVTVTGETKLEDRQAAVDRFQNDPTCRVFVGTIGAAGVGFTLTAAAHVVFAEIDWVPALVSQAEDRTHRIGQTNSVLVQHVVLDGSLDAKIARTLVAKQAIIDAALDAIHAAVKREPVLPVADADGRTTDRPRSYPAATAAQREAAGLCLQLLAGVCDGARKLDGQGFNRVDSRIGHDLATRSLSGSLTDGQVWLAQKIVRKYRRQLPEEAMAALCGDKEAEE